MKFTAIIPMFDVEKYLPELLKSLEDQTTGDFGVEYIFIDDGSPDDSYKLVEQWAKKKRIDVKLLQQVNSGVSAARNRGIEHAKGDWLTFPDPDDFISPTYFEEVYNFLTAREKSTIALASTNIIRYFEDTKEIRDTHALRFKFARGSKQVSLLASPHYIHMSAPTGFFRRDVVLKNNIRFMENLHASEDALFTANYLLCFDEPKLGIIDTAIYYYRKRADNSSALDGFKKNPETYLTRFETGYLPLILAAKNRFGKVPDWLASQVLYEYRWLFGAERSVRSRSNVLSTQEKQSFIAIAEAILSEFEDYHVEQYRTTPIHNEIRYVLQALGGKKFPGETVRVGPLDQSRNLVQVRYYFTGELPTEELRVRAQVVKPVHGKVRMLDYFEQQKIWERILWIPANSWISVRLDGIPRGLSFSDPIIRRLALTEVDVARALPQPRKILQTLAPSVTGARSLLRRVAFETKAFQERRNERLQINQVEVSAYALTKRPKTAMRFDNAWLFMDRLDRARDNAEHLYRYVKAKDPSIKVFFVLKKDSADWDRLRRDGFNLLEYGSVEHCAALLMAQFVISSHADVEMTNPKPISFYPSSQVPWRFVFLQHGITKDDLSLWLNTKEFAMCVTATSEEYESFTADKTRYKLTSKEVVLTGFPRFDRLHDLSSNLLKDKILIAPTWRDTLFTPKVVGDPVRTLVPDFESSEYYTNWNGLLNDPRLKEQALDKGLSVVFLVHPNLEEHVNRFDIPSWVLLASYDDDVQKIFASSALLVTDYSSVFFDVEYCGGHVHYFQFDRDAVFSGNHTVIPGYFDYDTHGFGPVSSDLDQLFKNLNNHIHHSSRDAFEFRDGLNSERTFVAIKNLRKRHRDA